ncbi:MAG: DUF3147 family protein [Leptospiraceae bacterium]|nr:DUF3147 family protein [Leptospiraceae bacterium]MDW8307153.1 DUF3147 family protein [Leptospiraceae bacterium]
MIFVKTLISALIIVLVSELAKYNTKAGAFILALPVTSVMTYLWLYADNKSELEISRFALETFYYVLPTLPFFVVFSKLLRLVSFWPALILSLGFFVILFLLLGLILRNWGFHYW